MFKDMGQLTDLIKNAGKIRENMEKAAERLGQLTVEGSAGGGAVTVRANGRLEILGVRIDPALLAQGDAEMLEDLIVAAVNQALVRAREEAARSLTGGIPIPPGMANLFGS